MSYIFFLNQALQLIKNVLPQFLCIFLRPQVKQNLKIKCIYFRNSFNFNYKSDTILWIFKTLCIATSSVFLNASSSQNLSAESLLENYWWICYIICRLMLMVNLGKTFRNNFEARKWILQASGFISTERYLWIAENSFTNSED